MTGLQLTDHRLSWIRIVAVCQPSCQAVCLSFSLCLLQIVAQEQPRCFLVAPAQANTYLNDIKIINDAERATSEMRLPMT